MIGVSSSVYVYLSANPGMPLTSVAVSSSDHLGGGHRAHHLVDDALQLRLELGHIGGLHLARQLVHRDLHGVHVAVRHHGPVLVGEHDVEHGAPAGAGARDRLALGELVAVGDGEAVLVVGVGLGGRGRPAVAGRAAVVARATAPAAARERERQCREREPESDQAPGPVHVSPPQSRMCPRSLRACRDDSSGVDVGRGRLRLDSGRRRAPGPASGDDAQRTERAVFRAVHLEPGVPGLAQVGDDLRRRSPLRGRARGCRAGTA